jgi:twitching motility protein PilT
LDNYGQEQSNIPEEFNTIDKILAEAQKRKASDVHITANRAITYRINGELTCVNDYKLTAVDTETILRPLQDEKIIEELKEYGESDFAHSIFGVGRYRVNIFRQRGSLAAAIRILPFDVPDPAFLGLPESIVKLTDKKRGLVLVTGATGSGKSTTLACLINIINHKYAKHIITLEDPIEYLHRHDMSIVNQREVGHDTQSYSHALRAALRQDPDVILVGEMRDLETISTAITAAETGHLVFSTLHTNNAASTIDRVIDVFPTSQQQQIRIQLSSVLEAVISQQLIPLESGKGRAAAIEVLLATGAVRNLIREAKSFQIPTVMQTSKALGMQTMDDALLDLYMQGRITAEYAVGYALDPNALRKRLNQGDLN